MLAADSYVCQIHCLQANVNVNWITVSSCLLSVVVCESSSCDVIRMDCTIQ